MPEWPDEELPSRTFAALGPELWAGGSTESTPRLVVEAAVRIIPGAASAGVSIVRNGTIDTVAGTSAGVYEIDEAQTRLGEGPGISVTYKGGVHRVDDLARDVRWPTFGPVASRSGFASLVSFELFVGDHTIGALNLYADRPFAFTARAEIAGRAFAPYAAVAVSASRQARQLEEGLRSRLLIGEAMGIVMERYHLTSEEAFERLTRLSQHRHVKLRDLAEEITHTGEV